MTIDILLCKAIKFQKSFLYKLIKRNKNTINSILQTAETNSIFAP
jgi:hypothetical protein